MNIIHFISPMDPVIDNDDLPPLDGVRQLDINKKVNLLIVQ